MKSCSTSVAPLSWRVSTGTIIWQQCVLIAPRRRAKSFHENGTATDVTPPVLQLPLIPVMETVPQTPPGSREGEGGGEAASSRTDASQHFHTSKMRQCVYEPSKPTPSPPTFLFSFSWQTLYEVRTDFVHTRLMSALFRTCLFSSPRPTALCVTVGCLTRVVPFFRSNDNRPHMVRSSRVETFHINPLVYLCAFFILAPIS